MKKQFFYAAMAVALMASCTSENEPVVDQTTPEAEEKVAIELGISSNAMTIGSRGTGIVGGVLEEGETDDAKIAAAKKWNSQELFVAMVKKDDGKAVEETNGYIFNGLKFRAPRATDTDNTIRIYTSDSYNATSDKGTLQYKYYPIAGAYDFYGYHVDDAGGTLDVTTLSSTSATVTGITIDGTQDIMAAKTLDVNATNYPDKDLTNMNPFSAKSARNEIKPILNFTHELARLKFYVVSGKGSNAAINNMGENGDTPTTLTNLNIPATGHADSQWSAYSTGAIYVTDIQVKNVHNSITLDLLTQAATPVGNADKTFTLMTTPTVEEQTANTTAGKDKNALVTLKPVAPKYAWNHSGYQTEKATEIGESIMFLPVTGANETAIDIKVSLGQCLVKTENESTDEKTYYWDSPKPVILTLDATTLKDKEGNELPTDEQKFIPGKSYNVYITIYGRERIEISAELTPWEEGGDIETDVENGRYEDENTGTGDDDDDTQNP